MYRPEIEIEFEDVPLTVGCRRGRGVRGAPPGAALSCITGRATIALCNDDPVDGELVCVHIDPPGASAVGAFERWHMDRPRHDEFLAAALFDWIEASLFAALGDEIRERLAWAASKEAAELSAADDAWTMRVRS
ncbi:hypothetical protein RHODGE_RHODGE_00991 [Rhodoplanes serenus]|uniref:Uncharacterized protein n=1 Tax=Rhodoplanes serenus TaxID=200615 RepID=A0A3S4F9H0_9BRAD|nr:hypothetical protein [Rhodoplanes serenus]VCU06620.1 hypothetical protein RHODPL_RHODPL_00068 [Rhodoplanes serenus]VCU07840.1 hypothetical protein RHODGE_RHODGE_00991 [Rhodoplanes serenus]